MNLLEKEYALKLSGRIGRLGEPPVAGAASSPPPLMVSERDYFFIHKLYNAYRVADTSTQTAFAAVCENMLKLTK